MATNTLADVALTSAWQDLTVTHASLVSANATIQCVAGEGAAIVFGGASPVSKSGIVLGPRDSVSGSAANVWARAIGGRGSVSVTLL